MFSADVNDHLKHGGQVVGKRTGDALSECANAFALIDVAFISS